VRRPRKKVFQQRHQFSGKVLVEEQLHRGLAWRALILERGGPLQSGEDVVLA
jgi:hypothetical protein